MEDEDFYDDETNDGQTVGDDSSASDGGDSSTITNDKQFKEDMNEDPAEEQRYCLCKDVSYGDMILCDNRRVYEFIQFHLLNYKKKSFLFYLSVLLNGFTLHALVLIQHRKENGFVRPA